MDRYIITLQGQPQSVLLGYEEYQGMKAVAELLNRPNDLASIKTGLNQLESGKRLSSNEARKHLRENRTEHIEMKSATEIARSVIDRFLSELSTVDAKISIDTATNVAKSVLNKFETESATVIPNTANVLPVQQPDKGLVFEAPPVKGVVIKEILIKGNDMRLKRLKEAVMSLMEGVMKERIGKGNAIVGDAVENKRRVALKTGDRILFGKYADMEVEGTREKSTGNRPHHSEK
jgi:hypothetical protein